MDSMVSSKIVNKALDKCKDLKPNVEKYLLEEDFSTLYHNGKEFYQVTFHDRTNEVFNGIRVDKNATLENGNELKEKLKEYNEKLKQAQLEAMEEEGIDGYDKENHLYFYRVGNQLGYCKINLYKRNKKEEQEKRRKEKEEHERLMEEDPEYRKEYLWYQEKDRPFGGAFDSWGDFWKWKEG